MTQGPSDNSDELIDRLRREGQSALADMFAEQRDRLHRMVQMRLDRRVASRVDASDVLQEAFVDASKQLDNYLASVPMPPFLWLRLMTGERVIALHRRHLGAQMRDARQEISLQANRRPAVTSDSLSIGLAGRFSTPSAAAVRAEVHAQLRNAIERLEPLDREIMSLRHFEELTNAEAAEELGITSGAASKRYIRALERLQGIVDETPGLSWNG